MGAFWMRVLAYGQFKILAIICFCVIAISNHTAKANPEFRYLDENAKKDGVKITKTGLQYRVLRKGSGKRPNTKSYVEVHYKGKLINGQEFDNSYDRKKPSGFELTNVIPGWTEGLQLMKEGAKYEFVIPSSLGYGVLGGGGGQIPPGATLIFEIELIKVY